MAKKDDIVLMFLHKAYVVFDTAENTFLPKSMKNKPKRITQAQLEKSMIHLDKIINILKLKKEYAEARNDT